MTKTNLPFCRVIIGLLVIAAPIYAADGEPTRKRSFLPAFNPDRINEELETAREQIKQWDQSVRGFRKEHSFSLMTGYLDGQWHYKRFGTQVNQRSKDLGFITKFHYTYHIQLYRPLGYFLGTSIGAWQAKDRGNSAQLRSSYMLPGILAGGVYNFNPGIRAVCGIDYYLERWNDLAERDGEGLEPTISVTARTTDLFAGMDFFYQLKWAVRMEYHERRLDFYGAKRAAGKPVDAVISRLDHWYGIGLLYHLM